MASVPSRWLSTQPHRHRNATSWSFAPARVFPLGGSVGHGDTPKSASNSWSIRLLQPDGSQFTPAAGNQHRTTAIAACIVGLTLVAAAAPALGQIGAKSKADDRVRRALRETDLKFTEDKDGDFKLVFSLEDDRRPWCSFPRRRQNGAAWRSARCSPFGCRSKTRFTQANLEAMLKENAKTKSGAWELHEGQGLWAAIFSVKVSADCGGEAQRRSPRVSPKWRTRWRNA